jgi:peptide chain release factor 2
VRLVHKPSGIVIFAQEQRSQHQNKDIAFKRLKARLYERELKMREEKATAEQAAKTDIGWGHQIRSYVLQPYQLVKDLRTGSQSSSPSDVLDGNIDQFIEATLTQRMKGGGPAEVADLD